MLNQSLHRIIFAVGLLFGLAGVASAADCPAYLNQSFQKLHSKDSVNICKEYAGKPLLIVNTASHCGFTPQFKGLEELHEKYKDKGLVMIGFSSNDFHQEDKDEGEAAKICYINYGVKFTILAPTSVKGDEANGVFKELARQTKAPSWNFNKYLVTPDGKVLNHFGSTTKPESKEMTDAVDGLLKTAAK